jgi:long-chain acyl-CoA synthetase
MLYELLAQRAAKHPDNPAVINENRVLTYEELHSKVTKTAAHLQSLGLRAGQSIVLGIPPCADFHAAMFAAAAIGLPSITVLPSGKISKAVVQENPAIAIGDRQFLSAASERCPSLRYLIVWDRASGLEIPNSGTPFKRDRIFRKENILAVSSSGTTGEPRLYFRPADMLVERLELRAKAHGIRADDVLLATRPYNSSAAINNQVIMPLLTGCSVVVHESFERFKIARSIASFRVTVILAAPFFYETMASLPEPTSCDLSSIRLCIAGGAPLAPKVARAFQERFGLAIHQWYAGSHIHPAFLYNVDGPPDCVGHMEGTFPARILGDNGHVLKSGEIGEIAFYLPGMPKQWQPSFELNSHRRGEYLHTGDLGRVDAAGHVYVVGRKSAVIKVGGNRVEPAEIEDVLRHHPNVKEAVVFGTPIGHADEIVEAIVEADGDLEEVELLKYCARQLDSFKCPRRITIKASLDRTEQGKVSRQILQLVARLAPFVGWEALQSAISTGML